MGWPAIGAGTALAVIGILARKPTLSFVAAGLLMPVSLYLSGTPGLQSVFLLVPFLVIGAGFAVHFKRRGLAWALLAPFLILVVLIAGRVLDQAA